VQVVNLHTQPLKSRSRPATCSALSASESYRSRLILRRSPGSGLPVPVAGHSLRPSWPSLARCWLRSAIHGCARQQRRLPGTGSPSQPPV